MLVQIHNNLFWLVCFVCYRLSSDWITALAIKNMNNALKINYPLNTAIFCRLKPTTLNLTFVPLLATCVVFSTAADRLPLEEKLGSCSVANDALMSTRRTLATCGNIITRHMRTTGPHMVWKEGRTDMTDKHRPTVTMNSAGSRTQKICTKMAVLPGIWRSKFVSTNNSNNDNIFIRHKDIAVNNKHLLSASTFLTHVMHRVAQKLAQLFCKP